MSPSGPNKLERLLDEAVARLAAGRRTFTDEEAFGAIWEAGYDVFPQSDGRFVLAREADGRHPRHWRLQGQVVANNVLLDALQDETWDGRELDRELVRRSAADGVHYVFCPVEDRFQARTDGVLEPAEREKDVALPAPVRAELDGFLRRLLERWRAEGGTPRTVREVAVMVAELGWPHATERGGWLLVRTWLLVQPAVRRVGQDFWVPTESMPSGPARTHLHVIPVFTPADRFGVPPAGHEETPPAGHSRPRAPEGSEQAPVPAELGAVEARWSIALRTVHLTEGFLPVPSPHRSAYPPRAKQSGNWEVFRGKWFETGDELWVWLDRSRDLLCGADLADRLAWCEAGERLGVLWTPEVLVFRSLGVEEEVRREETRLVDPEALARLRGGLGESYHQSLVAILQSTPEGLPLAELAAALCQRQKHEVHRGTVRAILHAGGFICRERRWFVTTNAVAGMRRLRRAIVTALGRAVPASGDSSLPQSPNPLRDLANIVKARLEWLITRLSRQARPPDEHLPRP
jgi:hypothetical protein